MLLTIPAWFWMADQAKRGATAPGTRWKKPVPPIPSRHTTLHRGAKRAGRAGGGLGLGGGRAAAWSAMRRGRLCRNCMNAVVVFRVHVPTRNGGGSERNGGNGRASLSGVEQVGSGTVDPHLVNRPLAAKRRVSDPTSETKLRGSCRSDRSESRREGETRPRRERRGGG